MAGLQKSNAQKVHAPVTTRVTATGKTIAEKPLPSGTMQDAKAYYQPIIDSLLKENKAKESALQYFMALSTRTAGEVLPEVTDSNGCISSISYSDRWLKIDYTKGQKLRYQVYDSLALAVLYKRPKWYRAKETFVTAYSVNPRSHVSGLVGFKIDQPKVPRFGIGPFIGIGYTGTGWAPSVGISLHYSLIRF